MQRDRQSGYAEQANLPSNEIIDPIRARQLLPVNELIIHALRRTAWTNRRINQENLNAGKWVLPSNFPTGTLHSESARHLGGIDSFSSNS
jgi:hypothetical protein